jgi:hypothetical protein
MRDEPVDRTVTFTAVVTTDQMRRVLVPFPFDPDDLWGQKSEHHVTGTVNGMNIRAVVEGLNQGRGILLGPAWRRDSGIAPGAEVTVVLFPEGPQRDDLALDVASALKAEPTAGEFFDALAQAYRTAYLRWIDATTRRPHVRAERIAEVVQLCKNGIKQRPR